MKSPFNAQERKAFDDGALSKRGGVSIDRMVQFFDRDALDLIEAARKGYRLQMSHPLKKITWRDFSLEHEQINVEAGQKVQVRKGTDMTTRSAEELEKLREEYRTTAYNPYAEAERAEGREPQPFDEAFDAHLAALDSEGSAPEGPTDADNATVGDPAPATTDKPKRGGKKADKPAAAPKAAKAAKYRPTSEDRKTLNEVAGKQVKEGTARMKLRNADGSFAPYDDFLKGVSLTDGKAEVTLGVFSTKDMSKPVGAIKVTIAADKPIKAVKTSL